MAGGADSFTECRPFRDAPNQMGLTIKRPGSARRASTLFVALLGAYVALPSNCNRGIPDSEGRVVAKICRRAPIQKAWPGL